MNRPGPDGPEAFGPRAQASPSPAGLSNSAPPATIVPIIPSRRMNPPSSARDPVARQRPLCIYVIRSNGLCAPPTSCAFVLVESRVTFVILTGFVRYLYLECQRTGGTRRSKLPGVDLCH